MAILASALWKEGSSILEETGIETFEYDSRVLMEWVCNVSRMDMIMSPSLEVSDEKMLEYRQFIKRRSQHEPLQYLIGEWEFMGLPFIVNPSVLIPRQDTEVLIEWILEREDSFVRNLSDKDTMSILDVCTGSGCIAISVYHYLKEHCSGILSVTGLDISTDALRTAQKNNVLNQTDVHFIESNMFENVEGKYDMIISNPPYIKTEVVEGLMAEVVNHEPRIALDGMEDGLFFYRILASKGKEYLEPGGRMYLEIGHDQGESVPALLKNEGFIHIEVKKDLAGLDRCVYAVWPS